MELTIIISIISCIIAVSGFVLGRKDKAVAETKENNLGLINYRLNELDKNIQKILDKLDSYTDEIDARIEKAIKNHLEMYHNNEKK